MLILVCALILALAIGCCVGGLMVRVRAGDPAALVRRNATIERSESGSRMSDLAGYARPSHQRPTPGRLQEPPAPSRS